MTSQFKVNIQRGVLKAVWTSIKSGEDGDPASMTGHPDKTVTVEGDFEDGTLTIQGRNDGGAWMTLHDAYGNVLEFTDNAAAVISENTEEIRPSMSTAAGADLKVTIIARS